MRFFQHGIFLGGKEDDERAIESARECEHFALDSDEEERVSSEERSCYNCLFRRWNKESFECLKLKPSTNSPSL